MPVPVVVPDVVAPVPLPVVVLEPVPQEVARVALNEVTAVGPEAGDDRVGLAFCCGCDVNRGVCGCLGAYRS